jgi:hypothetical protein
MSTRISAVPSASCRGASVLRDRPMQGRNPARGRCCRLRGRDDRRLGSWSTGPIRTRPRAGIQLGDSRCLGRRARQPRTVRCPGHLYARVPQRGRSGSRPGLGLHVRVGCTRARRTRAALAADISYADLESVTDLSRSALDAIRRGARGRGTPRPAGSTCGLVPGSLGL